MPLLPGHVAAAAPGLHGFDTNTVLTPEVARAFAQQGFSFCVRYLSRNTPQSTRDLSYDEARAILASGLALMAVQHVAAAGWLPSQALGAQYGSAAVANAQAVGLPPGINLWLDLEGIGSDAGVEDVIAYCNAWFAPVAAAGFVPGVYVGADCVLDGNELFWRLRTRHYWRSGSLVPDVEQRGYQLIQRITSAQDIVNGIEIDRDLTQVDALGDNVLWLQA